ncbi:MAG: PTS sugar transporter subunit IIB [Erysipelotrichaceae bacterium]|nr:PTS sugar transporter subunit IIB [Erysipelotrichaceae bacterium]
MSIVSARLDNRLLHGIVAAQWTPRTGANRVMVIDDKVANTPMLKNAMKLGKPAGCALSIINKETAYTNFKKGKYNPERVFVICDDPQIMLDLIQMGQKIDKLTVGGSKTPEDGEEATQVSKRAFVKKSDEDIFRQIAATGCKITVQYVPTDKEEPLSKFISL